MKQPQLEIDLFETQPCCTLDDITVQQLRKQLDTLIATYNAQPLDHHYHAVRGYVRACVIVGLRVGTRMGFMSVEREVG